jgi:Holliday junction resolvase
MGERLGGNIWKGETMIKEIDIGKALVEWLNVQHWDVYQEVKIYSHIADVVAVRNGIVWIIECKTSYKKECQGLWCS